jgi:hypothetical protein
VSEAAKNLALVGRRWWGWGGGESVWGDGIGRGSGVRRRGPGGGGGIGLLHEPLDLASVKEEKAIERGKL